MALCAAGFGLPAFWLATKVAGSSLLAFFLSVVAAVIGLACALILVPHASPGARAFHFSMPRFALREKSDEGAIMSTDDLGSASLDAPLSVAEASFPPDRLDRAFEAAWGDAQSRENPQADGETRPVQARLKSRLKSGLKLQPEPQSESGPQLSESRPETQSEASLKPQSASQSAPHELHREACPPPADEQLSQNAGAQDTGLNAPPCDQQPCDQDAFVAPAPLEALAHEIGADLGPEPSTNRPADMPEDRAEDIAAQAREDDKAGNAARAVRAARGDKRRDPNAPSLLQLVDRLALALGDYRAMRGGDTRTPSRLSKGARDQKMADALRQMAIYQHTSSDHSDHRGARGLNGALSGHSGHSNSGANGMNGPNGAHGAPSGRSKHPRAHASEVPESRASLRKTLTELKDLTRQAR